MARRKRKGALDDLFVIAAKLPWQVSHLGGMSPEQFEIAHKATRKRVH